MKKHVSLQLVVLDETQPADFTFERFFTCVNTNVSLQVVLEGEARSTRLTGKYFPSVDRLVCPERSPLCKSFATHRAFVRMLTSVNTSVALQRERVPETLPALRALVRLFGCVNDLMSLQVALSFEALPAGGADERPRARVHELMSLQVHFCFEGLVTDLALEGNRLPLLVSQQVMLKSRCVPEFPRALVAGEGFSVSVHVLLQVKLPVEALVADVTHKHLRFLPRFCSLGVLAVSVFGFCRVGCGIILCGVYDRRDNIKRYHTCHSYHVTHESLFDLF